MVKCSINGEKTDFVRFPITEVGSESTVTMSIENTYDERVELIPFAEDPDVSILEFTKVIEAGESGTAVWKFSPKRERETSLSCPCGFREIIG